MGTQKTQVWLSDATGTTKTQEETEWFLAYWWAKDTSELSAKEHAMSVQAEIASPTTYGDIERDLFCSIEDDEEEEDLVAWTLDFYGTGE